MRALKRSGPKIEMEKFPTMNTLLDDDNDEMDELFRAAFESMDKCKKSLDRLRPGAAISTPTSAADRNAWGLVPHGEGSREVRVPGKLHSQGLPL